MGKLFVISGDDDFSRKQRAREIIGELAGDPPEDNPALEIVSGDGGDAKDAVIAGRFLDALRTPPFLSDTKIVWLRHFSDLAPFCEAEPVDPYDGIIAFLSDPLPEELSVVIDGPGLDQRKSFARALKNAGAVLESKAAAKMTDRNYADSRRMAIEDFMRSSGKRIDRDAMQFLCEAVGGDAGVLANELEKLRCYVGMAPDITLADCREIVSRTPETISWEYTGAIVSGDVRRALRLAGIMLDAGEPEIKILAILSGEFQKMAQTRLAMAELGVKRPGPNTFSSLPQEVREKYPDNPLLKLHPYRAFKVCEGAARFSDGELAEKLTAIRDASRALVSGGGDRRIILEQLTLKLAAKNRK
ncbi:MAG: DNA polymerase III subunit delta [Lentisphaeria bacterium]|nr:DNA polymerase III subunit delta [Lentisphaeria bacterium]